MADATQEASKVADDRRKAREELHKSNKELLNKQKEDRAKSNAESDKRMSGKPTPTQEENDLARLGSPVLEKEDDGSGPDPHNLPIGKAAAPVKRDVTADSAGTYKTRGTGEAEKKA